MTGILETAGDLSSFPMSAKVCLRMFGGHISSFVTCNHSRLTTGHSNTGSCGRRMPRSDRTSKAYREDQRQLKGNSNGEVLLHHAEDTMVRAHHDQGVVREAARHARDGGLDVAFVAGEVDKCQHLCTRRDDFCPVILARSATHELSIFVKPQDLMCDAGCPTRFNFVTVAKNLASSKSTSIIQYTACQNSDQCALATVDVSHNSQAHVHRPLSIFSQTRGIPANDGGNRVRRCRL
mmetsp:Transcript_39037/g.103184  ORF Transcript_39037/g.103184 Transcript_39037/m.103184 type:complete len:236 (+) Transcript_39037:971-1678(+)